ncbi:MAG: hypothetical protein EB168_10100 [Euryarchaeota archaeon]|nr:hypothetical protein [Euryarchaeota archaeon]
MPRGQLAGISDAMKHIRSMNGAMPKEYGGLKFVLPDDVVMRDYTWLWDGMVAEGQFHVFAGESGIGKTQLLCNIAAMISRGGVFPGMTEPCKQGMVVYLSGEDSFERTILPRFRACMGDDGFFRSLSTTKQDGEPYALIDVLDDLKAFCLAEDVRLVIIDPITSFMEAGFDNNSVTSVRRMATRLRDFCESTGVAVIALNHLTKGNMGSPMHRILGSGAWVHAPRIVLGATKGDGNMLFGKWKTNISDPKPVYQYEMVEREVEGLKVVCVDWLDEVIKDRELSDFDAFATPSRGEKGELIHELLREELSNGLWHRSKELIERVRREAHCSERQIKRIALDEMKVEARRENVRDGHTSWRLPLVT